MIQKIFGLTEEQTKILKDTAEKLNLSESAVIRLIIDRFPKDGSTLKI